MGGWENIWLSARKLSFFPDRLSAHGHASADSVSRGSIASITGGVVRWTVLLSNLVTISLGFVCWNLLVASSAAARISDGLTRRFVYACYLDVDIVYNRSYIDCTGTRLPRSPPTSRSPR